MTNEQPNETVGPGTGPIQFGKYELLEKIGVGGMAEIFKARLTGFGGFEKILVVKKILPSYAANRSFVRMLVAEAKLCSSLQHANIVQIFELGEVDEQPYITMEHVHGKDLLKLLSRRTKMGQRIPIEVCLYIVSEVCKGLAYAHDASDSRGNPLKIIHRDVSPSNVILSFSGEVKIMDFGVAKASLEQDQHTRPGVLKGKLGYMSPEQVTGKDFDHRSDIFSLGIILYEAITLKRLFLGKTDLETLINIRDVRIEAKFQRHDYIPEGVRAILRKALAKDPADRYQTSMELYDAVQDFLFEHRHRITQAELARLLRDMFPDSQASLVSGPPLAAESSPKVEASMAQTLPGTKKAPRGVPPAESPAPVEPAPVAVVALAAEDASQASRADGRPRGRVAVPVDEVSVLGDERDVASGAYAYRGEPSGTERVIVRRESTGSGEGEAPAAWSASESGLRDAAFRLRGTDGQTFGPISFQNLVNLMKSRSMTEGELISVNEGEWVPASQIEPLRRVLPDFFRTRRPKPLYEGPVNHLMLPRLVYQIAVNRNTGVLKLSRGSVVKEIYFKRGRPRHIASSLKRELLGNYMVEKGLVPQTSLEEAIRRVRETGTKLGDVLIAMNIVRPYDLYRILSNQFRDKFLEIFTWTRGWYEFFEGESPNEDVIPLEVDPLLCIGDGVRQHYSLEQLELFFMDRLGRPYREVKNRHITVDNLRFNAKESRFYSFLEAASTLRELVRGHARSADDRLTMFRVVFLLFQTDQLVFEHDETRPPSSEP